MDLGTPTLLDVPGDPAPPILVTSDPGISEDLARLAAAAGVPLRTIADPTTALSAWSSAPVVLVGADQAAALAALRPQRRAGVHVVGWAAQSDVTYRSALVIGAEQVLELPAAAETLTDALTDLGEAARADVPTIGVLAGSGGAGATTLACALGQLAGRSGPALVVDLDPWGAGADRVLGLERAPGVRWHDLEGSLGRLSGRSLREAVPHRAGVGVLSWAPGGSVLLDPRVVRETMSAAARGHDLVVVDLPRSADPIAVEAHARCGLVALVVRPTLTGVAAAVRSAERVPDPGRLAVVVRPARGGAVDPRRVADAVGLPLLTTLPEQRGLAEALDLGLGPIRSHRGPLARTCRQVLAA